MTGSVLAQLGSGGVELGLPVLAASVVLIALSLGLAQWIGLGVGRQIVVASVRAAAQLLAVGIVLTAVFTSSLGAVAAVGWVVVMVVVAAFTIRRRADAPTPELFGVAAAVVAVSTSVSLAVVFLAGVLDPSPVAIVVMAGITIGNAMPSAVLGVNRAVAANRERRSETEALLSLGLNRRQVVRFMAREPARTALIPQIERTKVVGLIALPGAMTGLLLAGVDPVEAVLLQILVMFLVLGATALCSIVTVFAVSRSAITDQLVVAEWARTTSLPD